MTRYDQGMVKKRTQRVISSAPLTKVDAKQFVERIVHQIDELYAANAAWKEEIMDRIETSERNVKQHFDIVAENLHRDAVGANKDRIEDHERRITHLEAAAQR